MTDAPPGLLERPLVPVASDDDAVVTARAILPHVAAAGGRPTVVNVIEKAGGAIDKASVEQRELAAEEAFDAFRDLADDAGVAVETDVLYGTDVVDTLNASAAERDASAIVFVPRGGRSILDVLTGDVRDRLVTESRRPVVVLPHAEGADGDGSGATAADADPDAAAGADPDLGADRDGDDGDSGSTTDAGGGDG